MRPPRVVYLTFDGILSPLGYSQVVRVVLALARQGALYTIVSLEREADLLDHQRVTMLRVRLDRAGVDWQALTYDQSGTAAAAAKNIAAALSAMMGLAVSKKMALVHARGYHSALVAYALNRATAVPYLFDARGYWIDERTTEGRWFGRASTYRIAKELEQELYRRARAIVTLTETQAADLRRGWLNPYPFTPVRTITTCADFDEFIPLSGNLEHLPSPVRDRLEGRLVIGIVGSLNGSYRVDDMARLCRMILDEAPHAHLLVLSAQHREYETLLSRHEIPVDRYTLTFATHDAMPRWLPCVHWGLLLLNETFAKRASMPTKLAEFFAVGVRPIQYGCNPEVSEWVRRVGIGLVLPSLDEGALRQAARHIASAPNDSLAIKRAREIAYPYFSLASAAEKYQELLSDVIGTSQVSPRQVPAYPALGA